MTKIYFMGRWDFINLIREHDEINKMIDNDFALISINDTDTELQEMKQHVELHTKCDNTMFMQFQDVDTYGGSSLGDIQSLELFEFIEKNENKTFIVHCFAGVSRSAAVAKFINDYYDIGDVALNNYSIYNKLVYSQLNKFVGKMFIEDYYRELEETDRAQ